LRFFFFYLCFVLPAPQWGSEAAQTCFAFLRSHLKARRPLSRFHAATDPTPPRFSVFRFSFCSRWLSLRRLIVLSPLPVLQPELRILRSKADADGVSFQEAATYYGTALRTPAPFSSVLVQLSLLRSSPDLVHWLFEATLRKPCRTVV